MSTDLTEQEVQWAYESWCNGHSKSEIANALHISESKLKRVFKARKFKKQKPPLIPPKK